MEHISKEQWNQLNNEQQDEFQKKLGVEFENMEYPSHNDIVEFLKETGHHIQGFEELNNETPPVTDTRDINELWEDVINYFAYKEK